MGLDDDENNGDAPVPTSFNGADEEDVIDRIYSTYAIEAKNAVGESTGEKVVFKEEAQKAGKEIIETLRGIKGPQLAEYMKDHFEEIWANYDVNNDGEISLEESHTFQRALMGRLNKYVLAEGSVADVNATPLPVLNVAATV